MVLLMSVQSKPGNHLVEKPWPDINLLLPQGEQTIWRVGDSSPTPSSQAVAPYNYIYISFMFTSSCSLLYLSIISFPANIVSSHHSLASLAWQPGRCTSYIYSLRSILLVLPSQPRAAHWWGALSSQQKCPLGPCKSCYFPLNFVWRYMFTP